MVVTVKAGCEARVKAELTARGLWVTRLEDGARRVLFVTEAHSRTVAAADVSAIDGVEAVADAQSAHPRIDAQPARVRVAGREVGGGAAPVVMAGPCSVESEAQLDGIAAHLATLGVGFLRGGAFKPRSSPYAFQGHGAPALGWLRRAADRHGMAVVTEAMGAEDVAAVAAVADLIQVGSRNMQSYSLLRTIARAGKPVLLKRGMAATIEEWLLAGEYCLVHGAPAVIFCERGIRGFDPQTRNVLDLGAVALLAGVLHAPVIVDPSHAAGRRDLIAPLALAALGAGAAGLMLETHPQPGSALSDGPQALSPGELAALLGRFPHA